MTSLTESGDNDVLTWLKNLETLTSELRASETRFAYLIHNNPDGVLVLNQDGAILFANQAAATMFGRPTAALVGHVFGFPILMGEAGEIDLVTATGAMVAEMRVVETDWQGRRAYLAMLRDITERKRLESALRASEARLQAVIENTNGQIWSIDCGKRLLVANSAFQHEMQRHLGRPMLPGEAVLAATFPPQAVAFWHSAYDRALAGERFTMEVASQIQRPGGVIECSLSPICDESGVVTGAVGISRDITERRQLEIAVRTSEERLRYALDATSDGVWDWDIVTGDVVGGDRWFELFGYAPGEVPPTIHLWEDTLHPDDAADTYRTLADYLEGRAPSYRSEHRIITKSGEVRWHLSRGKVVARDAAGKPVRMVGTNADITERKIAEQRLRDSEERLRLVMQNSPDVIAVWDDRGMIEYLSPAPERTVGSMQAEIVRHEGLLPLAAEVGCSSEVTAAQLAALGMDPLSVENWLKMRDAVCYGIDHPGETVRVEYQQRIDSGELRDLEAVYQGFVRSDSGHEVVAITRDITEHKALQRLLHQANADLEERVAARTAELAATVSELHRANAGKDAFMAAVSHELRTPLVGILGMGELLQTQARGPLNPDQERYVAWIRESGERLLETVNSVLRYTSLMAEQAPVEREPCRLLELCASSVRTVKARAERKRQSIALDVMPADLMIVANTEGIINIVTTLLDNAVKFTPEDGALGVEVRCTANAEAVRLVVWDTGIGMTAEEVAALFRPFSQADQGLTRQFAGTGIGLAYVSKMVELLGGAIAVESAPGAGSRFIVTLPAVADSPNPENP